jgi:hypothetical protein
LAVNPDTKKQFNRRVDRYLNLNEKITNAEIRRQKQILVNSKDQVISDLATLPPTQWRMQFLPQLKSRINDLIINLDSQLDQSIKSTQNDMFETTVAKSDELTTAAGVDLSILPSFTDPELLSATQTLTGELIKTVPQRLTNKIGNIVAIGMMQEKSVTEILEDIRGVYSQSEYNAERIARTELLRTQSIAQEKRFEQIVDLQPDLLKTWKWSHLPDGRSGHAEAEMEYSANPIPFKDPFMVAPRSGARREAMQFPRDPAGSAGNVINCACIHLLLPPGKRLTEGVLIMYFKDVVLK